MDYTETWPRCPEAARFFDETFREFAAENSPIAGMAKRFLEAAGVDLRNLIDHWTLPAGDGSLKQKLIDLGFEESSTTDGDAVWIVPGARLPRVLLVEAPAPVHMAVAVDEIEHFLRANGLDANGVAGEPDSAYEKAHVVLPHGELSVVARRGYNGFRAGKINDHGREELAETRKLFAERERHGDESEVIGRAGELFESRAALVGQARAVDEFFAAERSYYATRNRAARWIYKQQEKLGFGWANHDHHTYRSSRASFYDLTNLWHTMGFISREKFYAGEEAGWGAQVLEHPISRIVIFADVDMAPEELGIDYGAHRLAHRDALGTIGLWCALHGSSIASGGMHHIECEFDFEAASKVFEAAGFAVMKPFTDLEMLKQRFTEPEMWRVTEERLISVLAVGAITSEQAQIFREKGAAGSHIEILQRWDGFKGFNKTGVSEIIRETDARRAAA